MAQLVDCGNEITAEDIFRLRIRTDKSGGEFFDVANKLLKSKPSRAFRNAEVAIKLPHQIYKLYAGNKTNKFAICKDEYREVKCVTYNRALWLVLHDAGKKSLTWIAENPTVITGLVTIVLAFFGMGPLPITGS